MDERVYWRQRADEEAHLASIAADERAAAAHTTLAAHYRRLLAEERGKRALNSK